MGSALWTSVEYSITIRPYAVYSIRILIPNEFAVSTGAPQRSRCRKVRVPSVLIPPASLCDRCFLGAASLLLGGGCAAAPRGCRAHLAATAAQYAKRRRWGPVCGPLEAEGHRARSAHLGRQQPEPSALLPADDPLHRVDRGRVCGDRHVRRGRERGERAARAKIPRHAMDGALPRSSHRTPPLGSGALTTQTRARARVLTPTRTRTPTPTPTWTRTRRHWLRR